MQAEIQKLKDTREGEVTHSGSNSQAGSQNSNLVPGSGPPPNKRQKTVSGGASEDEDDEEEEEFVDLRCTKDLVQMSEAASTFIEAAFSTKLKNSDRTSHAEKFGVPDSRWLQSGPGGEQYYSRCSSPYRQELELASKLLARRSEPARACAGKSRRT